MPAAIPEAGQNTATSEGTEGRASPSRAQFPKVLGRWAMGQNSESDPLKLPLDLLPSRMRMWAYCKMEKLKAYLFGMFAGIYLGAAAWFSVGPVMELARWLGLGALDWVVALVVFPGLAALGSGGDIHSPALLTLSSFLRSFFCPVGEHVLPCGFRLAGPYLLVFWGGLIRPPCSRHRPPRPIPGACDGLPGLSGVGRRITWTVPDPKVRLGPALGLFGSRACDHGCGGTGERGARFTLWCGLEGLRYVA